MEREVTLNLDERAHEYFGGDVQGYWITVDGARGEVKAWRVWQRPHRGPDRKAGLVWARTAREATRELNAAARHAVGEHA